MFKHDWGKYPDKQWLDTAFKYKEIGLDIIPWVPILIWQLTTDVTPDKPFHSLSFSFFFLFVSFAKPGQYYQFNLLSKILLRNTWVNSESALKTAIEI